MASSKREQVWKNSRELGKADTQTKVCIIFENSPNTTANSFATIDQHDGLIANLGTAMINAGRCKVMIGLAFYENKL